MKNHSSHIISSQFILAIFSLSIFTLLSCSTEDGTLADSVIDCTEITAENSDHCIRLNQIQVLGTHNSYKLGLPSILIEALNPMIPGWSQNIEYGHRTLTEQFEELGIRQIELDIFADPDGGLFAEPKGALLANDTEFLDQDVMNEPGFKILHVQDIDYRSTCLTFISCLEEVRDWSQSNPTHFPIMILVELKDSQNVTRGEFSMTRPIPFDADLIMDVDNEIWSVFDRSHVITPDDVRGDFETLEEAILNSGWPTLADSRGKVLFGLDNTGRHKDEYLELSPTLEKLAMFVSSPPGESTGGFIKMNNVLSSMDEISDYTERGFLVRTRSDIPTEEARSGDTTRRDMALESGAQYISTDYPELSPFGSGYIVTLPGAVSAARCNPVSAPEGCRNEWIFE